MKKFFCSALMGVFLALSPSALYGDEEAAYKATLKRGTLVVNIALQALDLAFFPASGAPPSGFFVDIFRVIATALFGDPNKISFYLGITGIPEMTYLFSNYYVDMALYHDYTIKDAVCGPHTCRSTPFFYTNQGFLLEDNPFLTQFEDLPTLTACLVDPNLPDADLALIHSTGLSAIPRVFSTYEEATSAFLEGVCEALWLPAHMAGSFLKTLLPSTRSRFRFLDLPVPVTYALFLPPGRLFTISSQALGVLVAADELKFKPEDLYNPVKKEAWHTFLKEKQLLFPLEHADQIIKIFGSYSLLFSKYFGNYASLGIHLQDNVIFKTQGGVLASEKFFQNPQILSDTSSAPPF